jgi:uncharacterized pyridoxamine 5'-phosphate oxidase family protein
MKIKNAGPGFTEEMNEKELSNFLVYNKISLHLGTIDKNGHPNIHPVWFYFDEIKEKIYINTHKTSKKFSNMLDNPLVYYCVDKDSFPYKGVRGKGKIRILENFEESRPIAENILIKYLGNLKDPMAKAIFESVTKNESAIIEIEPIYFSTWDDNKIKW